MEQTVEPRRTKDGISLRNLNFLTALLVILISILLLIATYRTSGGFIAMRTSADNYIRWQQSAHDLQSGSDYLTDQVRYFAVTGDRSYLDNYFREANETRRRDNALAMLQQELSGTPAEQHLKAAMQESVSLMEREYYSMRLAIEGNRYPVSEFPEVLQSISLSRNDAELSPAQQRELALDILLDQVYRNKKNVISAEAKLCIDSLTNDMNQELLTTGSRLQELLRREQTLIILLIVIVLLVRLLTSLLAISPLLRAVLYIKEEQPIPPNGAKELRFLANTYNQMYEENRTRTDRLTFSATHDKLTGAYNRSGYEYLLQKINLSDCALILLGVDLFKQINDTYGHETGDRVLTEVAATLHNVFLSDGYVCRIGGDEFAVILAEVNQELTEALRKTIRQINNTLSHPASDLPPVTLSVGIAFGADGLDGPAILRNADEALYYVKKNGRANCAFYAELHK